MQIYVVEQQRFYEQNIVVFDDVYIVWLLVMFFRFYMMGYFDSVNIISGVFYQEVVIMLLWDVIVCGKVFWYVLDCFIYGDLFDFDVIVLCVQMWNQDILIVVWKDILVSIFIVLGVCDWLVVVNGVFNVFKSLLDVEMVVKFGGMF